MSIFKDRKNHIWIGTDNEGLFQLNNEGKRNQHVKPDNSLQCNANTMMCKSEDYEDNC